MHQQILMDQPDKKQGAKGGFNARFEVNRSKMSLIARGLSGTYVAMFNV